MRPETIAMNQAVAARIDAALAAPLVHDRLEHCNAVETPGDAAALRAELQARLAYARELSQELTLSVDVAPGGPPIIGALKSGIHQLVVFYVNRLAARLEASRRQELAALEAQGRPVRVDTVVVSTQHAPIDALRQGRE